MIPGGLLSRWHRALAEQSPVAVATVIEGPGTGNKLLVSPGDHVGGAGNGEPDKAVIETARGMLEGGRTDTVRFGPRGQQRRMEDVAVFIQSFAPPPKMFVFGVTDFAGAVAGIGRFMGYRVIVCDARAAFATRERFPTADGIVVAWPGEFLKTAEVDGRGVVCILTHDPKFDVPVLKAALETNAGYIGVTGSRRTHDDRTARISSPIGLDVGARTPEATAVAIAAEIVAIRTGRAGGRLAGRSGPIHAPVPDAPASPDERDARRAAAERSG